MDERVEMTKQELKRFEDLLRQRRDGALAEFERDTQSERALEKSATPDIADKASLDETAEYLLQQEEHNRLLLREIDRALAKIKEGGFGLCERCEKAISKRRLQALPMARLCIDCQEEEEKSAPPQGEPRRHGPLSSEFLQQDAGQEAGTPGLSDSAYREDDEPLDML